MIDTRTVVDSLEKTLTKLQSDRRQVYCYHEDCIEIISKLSNKATYRDVFGVVTEGDRMEALNYYWAEEAESRKSFNRKTKLINATKNSLNEYRVKLKAEHYLEYLDLNN